MSEYYKRWWSQEGSAMAPKENEDTEEFANRITDIAWSNGEYCVNRDLEQENKNLREALRYIKSSTNHVPYSESDASMTIYNVCNVAKKALEVTK